MSRISQRYFGDVYQSYEKHKAEKNAERLRTDSENEFPNKRRNQILAAFVATLAMAGYALSMGIIEVSSVHTEKYKIKHIVAYFYDLIFYLMFRLRDGK